MSILRKLRGGALGFLAAALVEANPWGLFIAIAGGAFADDYFTSKNEQDIADRNRKEGFEHGVKTGNNETKKRFIKILKDKDEMIKAAFALAICVANLDDGICDDDIDKIQNFFGKIDSQLYSKKLKKDFDAILKRNLNFEEVKSDYLDLVESINLKELDEYIVRVIIFEREEKATEKEIDFYSKQWLPYMKERCEMDYTDDQANYDEAELIYRKGWKYEHGEGVIKNLKEALMLYQKATQMGHELAKNRLNFLMGVSSGERAIIEQQAKELYEKGYCYEHCVGEKYNREIAMQMYRKAAKDGYKPAIDSLKRLEGYYSYECYFYYRNIEYNKLHTKQNVYCELTLNSEEALKGSIKNVKFFSEHECEYCKGTGIVHGTEKKSCNVCHGKGIIKREETLKVNIPSGVKDGSTLRVAKNKVKGILKTDLYISVLVQQTN